MKSTGAAPATASSDQDTQHMWWTPAPAMPVELSVEGRRVTVVGSSSAAISRAAAAVRARAVVTVVAATPSPIVSELAARGSLELHEREFRPEDVVAADLVFALADDPVDNAAVERCAAQAGIFCVQSRIGTGAQDGPGGIEGAGVPVGSVTLVGGGPGDPGLLTIAGRAALSDADVVVTDRLAPVSILASIAPHAEIIDVSKVPGGRQTPQSRINEILVERARAGQDVVRLKGGDGFVFGRGGEEVEYCAHHGIAARVIPGVSSSVAAPASAMIPVTHRGLTQGFSVVSGHVAPDHPECTVDYRALARTNTTIVLMMAVGNLGAIAHELIDAGMSPQTPAAVVSDGSLTTQMQIRGPLESIAALAEASDVAPPATVVIGAVAGFAPALLESSPDRESMVPAAGPVR